MNKKLSSFHPSSLIPYPFLSSFIPSFHPFVVFPKVMLAVILAALRPVRRARRVRSRGLSLT
jgi:hypothetical protein